MLPNSPCPAETPDKPLRCLLIQPKFAETNYWNFVEGARAIGAKATAPPLGLLTVAGLLPDCWQLKLVDLNVAPLTDDDWRWADVICTGGMLPQQPGTLEIISRANQDEKYVVVGGPDPTSQPELYSSADAVVTGEGESSIPAWLQSWRDGQPYGEFAPTETVDIRNSPIPKFELISFDDYLHVGLQTSRGCPYNCEFCDVIELFGRKPRVKTPEQWTAELQHLYDLGYRGWVDIADDNFIGNRQKIKPLLHETAKWAKEHRYPFVLSTEASVNLADDNELLELMTACQFRYIFLGIETPDPEVLAQTQKRINTVKPLVERIDKIYAAGISVTAGFILGFDSEKGSVDEALGDFIEESSIILAMVGLLFALPNTQLTRRLTRERRLISHDHEWIADSVPEYRILVTKGADQTTDGLNFVTQRDRVEIYEDLYRVISRIYSPRAFMDRVLATTTKLNIKSKHLPGWWEGRRMLRGFLSVSTSLLRHRDTRWLYLRNAWKSFWMGPAKLEFAHTTMGSYLHFQRQSKLMQRSLLRSIQYAKYEASYPRSVADAEKLRPPTDLPVLASASQNCDNK
ncbi:MAG: radical SAM protein [Aureliella sp.]